MSDCGRLRGTFPLMVLVGAVLACTSCARDADEAAVFVHYKLQVGDDNPGQAMRIATASTQLFLRPVGELRSQARELGAPDLSRWWRVPIPASAARSFAAKLRRDSRVVSAFVAPTISLPVGRRAREETPLMRRVTEDLRGVVSSCPVETPSYEPRQGYLAPAPAGIGVESAWRQPGGQGQKIRFADIEGGWNESHEDLPGERMKHVAGRKQSGRDWVSHGTAVVGEIAAKPNAIGMVGIAPQVEKIVTASFVGIGPAAAIDAAASELRPGDVLLIELQGMGPRGRYLPMEFWDDAFDAISLATARGIIVIEAAGNGAEDLDHPGYQGRFDPRVRDSGAIMVGAGAPAREGWPDRSRLDFSNYGARVDVQGWGREVASLEYGDLQSCSNQYERDYTDRFSGTSSASPIVAGAAILIQSMRKAKDLKPLAPKALRQLLVETGSPQTEGPHGDTDFHIGPRPDLKQALEQQLRPHVRCVRRTQGSVQTK